MKFSIIVPIYKVEKYLKECIESVLSQSFQDFELILIDDGSPDNCPVICDEYADKDSRVKVIHQKNGGVVKARQSGANVAVGDYIFNLDGDDFWQQGYLQHYANILDKYQVDFVCGGFTKRYKSEDKIIDNFFEEGLYSGEKYDNVLNNLIYNKIKGGFNFGGIIYGVCAKIVKNEIYKKAQLLVNDKICMGEDLLFTVKLFSISSSFYISKFYGYIYRDMETSITNTIRENDIENMLYLYEEIIRTNTMFKEQIKCYCFIYFYDLLGRTAKMYCYKIYKNFIKKSYTEQLDEIIKTAKLRLVTKKDKLKSFLLKHHNWKILYKIFNNKFRQCK